jgi:hypothetical protein
VLGIQHVQYIGEESMILNRYVTKAEKTETEGIWGNLDQSRSVFSKYKSAGLQLIGKRDTGGYEAADKLLGNHQYGSSDYVLWVGADMPTFRSHRLLPLKELDTLDEQSTDMFYKSK